jgi:hypothetical protein
MVFGPFWVVFPAFGLKSADFSPRVTRRHRKRLKERFDLNQPEILETESHFAQRLG